MSDGLSRKEQIIGILRKQEAGTATADVYREHGIAIATYGRMEGQVRWPGGVGRQAAGRRERQAEEAAG